MPWMYKPKNVTFVSITFFLEFYFPWNAGKVCTLLSYEERAEAPADPMELLEETPVKIARNWSCHFSRVICISFVSSLQGRESSILALPVAWLEGSWSSWLVHSDSIPFSRLKDPGEFHLLQSGLRFSTSKSRLFGIKGLHGWPRKVKNIFALAYLLRLGQICILNVLELGKGQCVESCGSSACRGWWVFTFGFQG